jgi:15-cis-phytoene synthase
MIREHARSFAFAARFLPAAMRPDVHALYAFCRTVDDLVDEPLNGMTREQVRHQLDEWQRWLANTPVPPNGSAMTNALAAVVNRRGIPRRHLIELVEGCKSDLQQPRFERFDELERYCYRVGSTVGLAMCPILGVTAPSGLACARDLGIAMQLTNILRDVREDVAMGRHYLPADELQAFGCLVEAPDERGDLPGLIRLQSDRARRYYASGREGIRWVQPAARFAIRLSASLYEAILDKIAQQRFDVYACRASTTLREKVWLAVRLRLAGGL